MGGLDDIQHNSSEMLNRELLFNVSIKICTYYVVSKQKRKQF